MTQTFSMCKWPGYCGALVVGGIALNGCIVVPPIPSNVCDRIHGSVVDAHTGLPIHDAHITAARAEFKNGIQTDAHGRYEVGPLQEWVFLLYLGSPGMYPTPLRFRDPNAPFVLTAAASGYEPQSRSFFAYRQDVKDVDKIHGGDFRLEPAVVAK